MPDYRLRTKPELIAICEEQAKQVLALQKAVMRLKRKLKGIRR